MILKNEKEIKYYTEIEGKQEEKNRFKICKI